MSNLNFAQRAMAKGNNNQINEGMKLDSEFVRQLCEQISHCQNAVAGFADMLDADGPNTEHQEFLSSLESANTEARELVLAVLEIAEIDSDKLAIKTIEFSVEDLFSEICSILQPKAAHKGLEFAIMYSKPIPARMKNDRGILRDCLLNLAGDAINSVEGGHVHIVVDVENREDRPTIKFNIAGCNSSMCEEWCMAIDFAHNVSDSATLDAGVLKRMVTSRLAQAIGGKIFVTEEDSDLTVLSLAVPMDPGFKKDRNRTVKKLTEVK